MRKPSLLRKACTCLGRPCGREAFLPPVFFSPAFGAAPAPDTEASMRSLAASASSFCACTSARPPGEMFETASAAARLMKHVGHVFAHGALLVELERDRAFRAVQSDGIELVRGAEKIELTLQQKGVLLPCRAWRKGVFPRCRAWRAACRVLRLRRKRGAPPPDGRVRPLRRTPAFPRLWPARPRGSSITVFRPGPAHGLELFRRQRPGRNFAAAALVFVEKHVAAPGIADP